jgi:hypothetical protein
VKSSCTSTSYVNMLLYCAIFRKYNARIMLTDNDIMYLQLQPKAPNDIMYLQLQPKAPNVEGYQVLKFSLPNSHNDARPPFWGH